MDTKELITLLLGELEARSSAKGTSNTELSENRLLLFTDKEIMKMPKTFRKSFRLQGKTVHYRLRTDGRYNKSYEIRYAKKPFSKNPISASGTTLAAAKANFIKKLTELMPVVEAEANAIPTIPTDFDGFAMYWLENFHKRKVCTETYKKSILRYRNYIEPVLGNYKLGQISAVMIQRLLDDLSNRHRVEEDTYSMLNQIFAAAVKHGIIKLNPVGMVFHKNGDRKHGTLIDKDEEQRLLQAYAGLPEQIVFAVMLYTGLRPNEYSTAVIDGEFIKAKNSKRKNGKQEVKRIPITQMLRPYLNRISELPPYNMKTLDRKFKAVLPNHKLYDMRTTFQTRCTECGVAEVAIGLFMGNSIGALKKAYTDVSEDYLLREGSKIKY